MASVRLLFFFFFFIFDLFNLIWWLESGAQLCLLFILFFFIFDLLNFFFFSYLFFIIKFGGL